MVPNDPDTRRNRRPTRSTSSIDAATPASLVADTAAANKTASSRSRTPVRSKICGAKLMTEVEHDAWLKKASHVATRNARDSSPRGKRATPASVCDSARTNEPKDAGRSSADGPKRVGASEGAREGGSVASPPGVSAFGSVRARSSAFSFSTALHRSMSSASTRAVLRCSPSISIPLGPSLSPCITSRASGSLPRMTNHLGDSGRRRMPTSMPTASATGAATMSRQFPGASRSAVHEPGGDRAEAEHEFVGDDDGAAALRGGHLGDVGGDDDG